MIRLILSFCLLLALPAAAQDAPATHGDRAGDILAATTAEEFLVHDPSDVFEGDPGAPLTIYEFSSFTCPHCARFHTDILPTIREEYVDTGKVNIAFRDFPLDQFAALIGLIGQCLIDPDAYYGFVETVFAEQSQWRGLDAPFPVILGYAEAGGLSNEQATACFNNQESLDFIVARRTLALELVPVHGTPTLMLGTELLNSNNIHVMRSQIDAALAAVDQEATQ